MSNLLSSVGATMTAMAARLLLCKQEKQPIAYEMLDLVTPTPQTHDIDEWVEVDAFGNFVRVNIQRND